MGLLCVLFWTTAATREGCSLNFSICMWCVRSFDFSFACSKVMKSFILCVVNYMCFCWQSLEMMIWRYVKKYEFTRCLYINLFIMAGLNEPFRISYIYNRLHNLFVFCYYKLVSNFSDYFII